MFRDIEKGSATTVVDAERERMTRFIAIPNIRYLCCPLLLLLFAFSPFSLSLSVPFSLARETPFSLSSPSPLPSLYIVFVFFIPFSLLFPSSSIALSL